MLSEAWAYSADDVLLHALPLFHVHGLFVALNLALINGGSVVLLPKFDLDAVLSVLPDVSVMMGVPTYYTRLLLIDVLIKRSAVTFAYSFPVLRLCWLKHQMSSSTGQGSGSLSAMG